MFTQLTRTHRLLRGNGKCADPEQEFAARRDSLAKRIDSGVVVAFGGRTPVTDFGPFLPAPGVSLPHQLRRARRRVRDGRAHTASATSTLFLTPADPRSAFYYGWRPDSAGGPQTHGIDGAFRSRATAPSSTRSPEPDFRSTRSTISRTPISRAPIR